MLSRRGPADPDIGVGRDTDPIGVRDIWFGLAALIGLATIINVLSILRRFFVKPRHGAASSEKYKAKDIEFGRDQYRPSILWRIPSSILATFKIVAFRFTVPFTPHSSASVLETVLIALYIAGNIWITLSEGTTLDAWEDRSAHIASAQIPLVVALASKNNIISLLTGIPHEKLNILHRASSRTLLVILWMHAIGRILEGLVARFALTYNWVSSGLLALISLTLMTVLSIRVIRNKYYEFFLLSHIALVIIFLFAGFFHARATFYETYIWPAGVVWFVDRSLRLLRVLWNNRVWSKDKKFHQATVDQLSPDTLRLTSKRKFKWKAGQHAYITLPTISDFPTQAHPFTIASISDDLDGTSGSDEKEVVFIIRARNGFTKNLLEHATNPEIHKTVPAFIDGPYGCPPTLTTYSTCVLIAGGSGVSYTLPLLLDIVHNARANKTATKRVVFVWSIRDAAHIHWISEALTKALVSAPATLTVEPRVYVTGPNFDIPQTSPGQVDGDPLDGDQLNGSETAIDHRPRDKLPLYNALKITHGRPSIPKVLHDEVNIAAGPVSVDVAGPYGLSQSVKKAVRSARIAGPVGILNGRPPVTLHVESFGM